MLKLIQNKQNVVKPPWRPTKPQKERSLWKNHESDHKTDPPNAESQFTATLETPFNDLFYTNTTEQYRAVQAD